jgi:hypothetical protein
VESLNMSLRKVLKTREAFPSEEAALKVMYLALRKVIRKWECPQHWRAALNRSRCCGKRGSRRRDKRDRTFLRPEDSNTTGGGCRQGCPLRSAR